MDDSFLERHTLIVSLDVTDNQKCNDILQGEGDHNRFYVHWNSRSHRKRRYHPTSLDRRQQYKFKQRFKFYECQWSNLSWWVPFLFTLGSMVWLINGYFSMWPLVDEPLQAQLLSWTAFWGGLIFIFGAYTSVLEVINRPSHIHLRSYKPSTNNSLEESMFFAHHSHSSKTYSGQPKQLNLFQIETANWGWWLNIFQLIGAVIFFIACVSGLFLAIIKAPAVIITWFWLPQMVGAVFFMISSIMAMLEMQDKVYLPAFNKIGWNSALCNLIGAIGFFICAYYGAYFHQDTILYWGSDFSTFWGSIAFLISSYLMLLEVINP